MTFLIGGLIFVNFPSQTEAANKTTNNSAGATVTLSNFMFAPKTVKIKAGGTVTWKVKEGSHTVKADDGSFNSGTINAGQSFSKKFDTPGTYKYFCSFHGSAGGHDMAGTIIVTK